MKARDARTMNRNETRGGGAEPGPREMKAELLSVIGAEAAALLRDEVAAGLASYAAALMRWNRHMNLVGARDWRGAARDLLADSLELAVFFRALQTSGQMPAGPEVWDLGAGAGLPGIPLRLVWPDGDYHLVEARQKRSIFLADMCARLELPRTFVHGERAERFFAAREGRGQVVVSRAFMPWEALLDFVTPHMARPALVICLTNAPAPEVVPQPWRVAAAREYAAPGAVTGAAPGRRWFWALTTERESRA